MTRWWKHCWLRGRRHRWSVAWVTTYYRDASFPEDEPDGYECRECGRRA